MKKAKILAAVLAAAMLLASCGGSEKSSSEEISVDLENPPSSSSDVIPEGENKSTPESQSTPEVAPSPEAMESRQEMFLSQLADLTKDEYPELVLTAAILERKAIVSGGTVTVHVNLNNTGDKTVNYVMGSGANVVPDSLYVYADGLQTVRPKESYGAVTMDFRTATLEPGATAEFTYTIALIEPVANFDDIAFKLMQEGKYVGELPLAEYAADYPELKAAAPGAYTGQAVLMYSALAEGEQADVTGNPTGYTQVPFNLTVSD